MLEFNILKKNLKKDTRNLKQVRLALLSDTASQLTAQAIRGYGIERGIDFNLYEADYDQIALEILNPGSELYASSPEFIFINLSTEHLVKKFYGIEKDQRSQFASQQLQYLQRLFTSATKYSAAKILLNNFIEINDAVFGNYALREKNSFLYQLRKLNISLMEWCQEEPGVHICDFQSLQSSLGRNNIFDPKLYINADIVYSLEFLPHLAKSVTDIVSCLLGQAKKCVILDLDNTLWGGVIGDDGMEGIQIGSLGIGKAFSEFQCWLRELKKRGILLAVCSKNTKEIAEEPFMNHPDMVLRMEDIAIFVANWETKVDNIRHIQSILNIGMDSIVFLDDNKFEREMLKSAIPELTVPDLPEDPAEYLTYLQALNLFETTSFTDEDEERTRLYQEEASRISLQKTFENEGEFLESLDMMAEVKTVDSFSAPRVAQLTQRSNQFNLRTVRYSESDILNIVTHPDYFTLTFSLQDKFGQHGLISAVILKKCDDQSLFVDTWIMSCRVLKRGMEQFVLNSVVDIAKKHAFSRILGEYIPTKKNGLVKEHYPNLGFDRVSDEKWELHTAGFTNRVTYIKSSL
jgi:FkbH-like protein